MATNLSGKAEIAGEHAPVEVADVELAQLGQIVHDVAEVALACGGLVCRELARL